MSGTVKTWSEWLNNSRFSYSSEDEKQEMMSLLFEVRNKVLDRANLKPTDSLIDIGTGAGLLAFGAYERLKNSGRVTASDAFIDCVKECKKEAEACGIDKEITFIQADATDTKLTDDSFDVVITRSVLVHIIDKPKAINEFFRILKKGGRFSSYEAIMSKNTKFYEFINPDSFPDYEKFKKIEDKIMSDKNDPLMNFDEDSLKRNLEEAGFKNINIIPAEPFSEMAFSKEVIDILLEATLSVGQPSMKEKYLRHLSEKELNGFIEALKSALGEKIVTYNLPKVYIYAEKS